MNIFNLDQGVKEMKKLKSNEYRCAVCKGVYEKGWSDEEAIEELGGNFPGIDIDDCGVVCDDCYKEMGFN